MREELRRGLVAALKSRDAAAISAIRSALAAIDNAEAPPARQDDGANVRTASGEYFAGAAVGVGAAETEPVELGGAELRGIVRSEIDERTAAAADYDGLGRPDAAERCRAEARVLGRFL